MQSANEKEKNPTRGKALQEQWQRWSQLDAKIIERSEIINPKGLDLLTKILQDPQELDNFINNKQDLITIEHLSYFDFTDFSGNLLNNIKQKLCNFIQQKMRISEDKVWNKLNKMLLDLSDVTEQTVFKKITKLKLILELTLLVDKPYNIAQPKNTNLCGPAAILTCIFSECPHKFIATVEEFFATGKVDQPLKMLASSYAKKQDYSVVVAMMIGMKHASNYYFGYNNGIFDKIDFAGGLEMYCGLTEPSQMVSWLQNLGCNNLYEDISVNVPSTKYSIPHSVVNLLLWRKLYSANHKTILNNSDRLPILEDFIKNPTDRRMILLFDEFFWDKIFISHFNEKYKHIGRVRMIPAGGDVLELNVGHYVYLYSLKQLPMKDEFEFTIYADGELITKVIDKNEFLNNLKGIISIDLHSLLMENDATVENAAKRRKVG